MEDRVGEGRACWSLGNAHTALGMNEEAIKYASKHLEISKEVGAVQTGVRCSRRNPNTSHLYENNIQRNTD